MTNNLETLQYNFPTITNISDVLPHISGRTEFKVMHKDGYSVVNYVVNYGETFDWDANDERGSIMRRECRGLIFDSVSGELLSRPYHKFFNVGEKQELLPHNIDLSVPHILLEKLDGSMIRPVPSTDLSRWRLGTKAGVTDVAMNAEVWVSRHSNYSEFIDMAIVHGLTPLFEWCSRKNQVVVDHPQDRLVLTAVRHNERGFYLPYKALCNFAQEYELDLVQVINSATDSISELVDNIRAWDDGEGVVIRFESENGGRSQGHMLKIKADAYLVLHKAKDAISLEKNVVEVVLNDKVDDLLPILTEPDSLRLRNFQSMFWAGVDKVAAQLTDEYVSEGLEYSEQKDFAQQFVSTLPKPVHPFMFGLRKGLAARDMLVEAIAKSTVNQTKVDASRWMWGGHKWTL